MTRVTKLGLPLHKPRAQWPGSCSQACLFISLVPSDPGHAVKPASLIFPVAQWPKSRILACLYIFACCRVTGVKKGLPSSSACYTVTRVTQLGLPLHFTQWPLPMIGLPFPFPFVQWSGSRIWGCLSLACFQITRIKQLDLPLRYITDKDCCYTHFHVVLIVTRVTRVTTLCNGLAIIHSYVTVIL